MPKLGDDYYVLAETVYSTNLVNKVQAIAAEFLAASLLRR